MTSKDVEKALQERVDRFVGELSVLIRQSALEAVRDALGEAVASPAPRGRRAKAKSKALPSPARRKSRRGRRTEAEVEAASQEIYDYVAANPGQGAEQIRAALGVSSKDLKTPVTKLLEAGRVRTEGQRRGTKYFPAKGRKGASKKPRRRVTKKRSR